LTGAGWGGMTRLMTDSTDCVGCTIYLVPEEIFDQFYVQVKENYFDKYRHLWSGEIGNYLFRTSAGSGAFACIIDLSACNL
jgi:hypothetical protein